ncbi:MAG TPA: hydrogenase maturation protease [Candidatus Hydrogenedentes bacterium]|nr:hydrogenase maturation protease [Candidatus Hydrogenedentota bacterium]
MPVLHNMNDGKVTREQFASLLTGKVVFIGVGNTLRGDDAAGPALVAALSGKIPAVCLEAGTTPENYIGVVLRETPDVVVIVDVVHTGQPPGSCDLLNGDEIGDTGLSTHMLSPRLFIDCLKQETPVAIYLLAIQPEHLTFGAEMSLAVREALAQLEGAIIGAMNPPNGPAIQ